jgi:2-keto-4-pentenoate hydratase
VWRLNSTSSVMLESFCNFAGGVVGSSFQKAVDRALRRLAVFARRTSASAAQQAADGVLCHWRAGCFLSASLLYIFNRCVLGLRSFAMERRYF